MADVNLNTRISLKYDSYSNWTTNNPVLLKGEVALATIASGDTQEVNSVAAPQVLIKVGDGTSTYTQLPFASAKAVDVYSWAKKSEADFTTWVKALIDVTDIDLSAYATIEYVDGEISELQGLLMEEIAKYVTTETFNNTVATLATKEELSTAQSTLQGNIDLKANATDVYTKEETNAAIKVATDANDALAERVTEAEGAIETLNGNDTVNGSVDKKIKDAINTFATEITDNNTIDTYKEILDYIATHDGEANDMMAAISTLEGEMDTAQADIGALKTAMDTKADADDLTALSTTVSEMDAAYKLADEGVASAAAADATSKANAAEAAAKAHAEEKATAAETAAKSYAEEKAGEVNTALEGYKTTNDAAVEAIDGRVAAIEADYLKAADTYIFNCGNSAIGTENEFVM